MENTYRRPRRPRTLSDNQDGHQNNHDTRVATTTTTTSPHTLSIARSLIDQLPDNTLRDVLHSVAHLTLVQEALVASVLPPTSSVTSRSKRPKRSSPTPTGSRHGSPSPYLDNRPNKHDLSATTQLSGQADHPTPQMHQMRKQLLALIHRVNVYYSNTFNTADAVTCLLNIAHRALDSESVPIKSTNSPEPGPITYRTPSELASSPVSSLPTPPRISETVTTRSPPREGDIIPMADDILSSLVMILMQHPRSKHATPLKTASQSKTPAWTESETIGDDCDLTDTLLEMVYALLDHDHYRERPLAICLSEFLVEIALQRERKFREQERQKRKPLLAIQSGSGRFIDRWRQGLKRLDETSSSNKVDSHARESSNEGEVVGLAGVGSMGVGVQNNTKKRLREQQPRRWQPRIEIDRHRLEQDDWESDARSDGHSIALYVN
ncbi:hypothetical protein EC991_007816 [Linnemannia zychae]|nr:hypothetical protein EC991_007816 [Linnemannia zychae]